jgi:hypothetical protein
MDDYEDYWDWGDFSDVAYDDLDFALDQAIDDQYTMESNWWEDVGMDQQLDFYEYQDALLAGLGDEVPTFMDAAGNIYSGNDAYEAEFDAIERQFSDMEAQWDADNPDPSWLEQAGSFLSKYGTKALDVLKPMVTPKTLDTLLSAGLGYAATKDQNKAIERLDAAERAFIEQRDRKLSNAYFGGIPQYTATQERLPNQAPRFDEQGNLLGRQYFAPIQYQRPVQPAPQTPELPQTPEPTPDVLDQLDAALVEDQELQQFYAGGSANLGGRYGCRK